MKYEILQEIGLTESEAKVYLSLLDLGNSTTGPIIQKAGIASSKINELLNKLIDKGLVTTYVEDNMKHFKSVNPERLKDYMKEKKEDLDKKEGELLKLLPMLKSKYNQERREVEVEVSKGYKGIHTVFNDILRILKKGDEFLVIGGSGGETENERTEIFFESFHRQRKDREIKLRIIFSEFARKRYKKQAKFKYTQARYLPYGTPSTINIYKDTTILLVMSPFPAAIKIKDKNTTESFKKYFEQMWEISKK